MKETKKIFLMYPPSPVMNREDRCQQPVKELLVIPPLPPMDLMYMAAVSQSFGLEAKIVDYSLEKDAVLKFQADMENFQPDYLVINVATTTLESDLAILNIAKKILPNVIAIVKGAHFLTENTDILYKYKDLDLIIVGEAEETLKEILSGKDYCC